MQVLIISHIRFTRKSDARIMKRVAENMQADSIYFLGWPGLHPQTLVDELGNFLFITSYKDDIAITKEGRKRGLLLDGKMIKQDGLVISGIGGINPHHDMERLRNQIYDREGNIRNLILSYFPPYGCGDHVALLGKKRGLVELLHFLAEVRPDYLISAGEKKQFCRMYRVNVLTLDDSTNAALVDLHEHFQVKDLLKLP